jgi:uncharacterized membrane protein
VNQGNRGQMEPLSEMAPSGKTQFLEIDPKVAAYSTYIPIPPLNLILAGIWFAMEPNNTYAKFHATQSLIFSGAFFVLYMGGIFLGGILHFIPFIGGLLGGVFYGLLNLVALAYLVFSVICMIKVYNGQPVNLPYVTEIAEKYSRGL